VIASVPAHAATLVRSSVEELARGSVAVVRGRVETRACRWEGGRIFTDVVIAPAEIWRGEVPGRVTVVVPGGALDGIGQRVVGAPSFTPGEDVVVFLARAHGDRFRVNGFGQGKYAVIGTSARPDLRGAARVGAALRAGERDAGEMDVDELRRRVEGAR
jgi:hypothetical protein